MYTTEKQATRRLTGRKRSGRRWLLIPALCAVLILAVVLIVELGKSPRCCPPKRLSRRFHRKASGAEAYSGADSGASDPGKPLEPGAGGLVCGPGDPAQRAGDRQALL